MELEPIEDFSRARTEELHGLLTEFSGWEHRELADVERAVEHSDLVVGLVDVETDTLVAAARVLTDRTYYAKIYDVIVSDDHRRQGIGTRLISEVVEHPAVAGVSVLQLACRDGLVPFYRRLGFEPVDTVATVNGDTERFRVLQRSP